MNSDTLVEQRPAVEENAYVLMTEVQTSSCESEVTHLQPQPNEVSDDKIIEGENPYVLPDDNETNRSDDAKAQSKKVSDDKAKEGGIYLLPDDEAMKQTTSFNRENVEAGTNGDMTNRSDDAKTGVEIRAATTSNKMRNLIFFLLLAAAILVLNVLSALVLSHQLSQDERRQDPLLLDAVNEIKKLRVTMVTDNDMLKQSVEEIKRGQEKTDISIDVIQTSVEVLRSNDNSTALKLDQIMKQNSELETNDEKLMQKSQDIETNLGVLSSNDNQTHLKLDEVIEQNNQLESVNEEILDTADNIETKVEAVANATQESDERRDAKMNLILGETQEISKKVSNPCPSDGIIGNNGVRYFPLLDQRRNATDAERACNDLDSRLADVGSKMTYEQLVILLLQRLEERGGTGDWYFTLGMTFAPDSGTAYFRNGTEAAFTPWATGVNSRLPFTTSQDASYSSYTQLLLRIEVGESVTSKRNGFVNFPPSYTWNALCQRDVN